MHALKLLNAANFTFPARHSSEVLSIRSVNRYGESTFSAYSKGLSPVAPGEHVCAAAPGKSVTYIHKRL